MSLHRHQYGNPADIIERRDIRDKGCRVCARAERAFGRAYCPNNLRFPTCRGDRKKGFKLIEVDV